MPTKHHYVPKFYLKGFLDKPTDSHLWIVDLEEQLTYSLAPKNIASLPGYYEIDKIGDEVVIDKSMFEKMLSSIESKASEVIQKIRNNNFNITEKDRFNLSNFIGLQWGRVPANRDFIAHATTQFYEQRWIDLIEDDDKLKQEFGDDVEGFKTYARSIQGKIVPKKDFLVPASLKIGMDFAELIFGMTWMFLSTKGQSKFFTSDNPVRLLSSNAKPLKIEFGSHNPDLEIAFVISPSCALLAHNHDRRDGLIMEIGSNTVDKLNWQDFRTIHRYIFCSTEMQAKNLLETYNLAKSKGFPKDP